MSGMLASLVSIRRCRAWAWATAVRSGAHDHQISNIIKVFTLAIFQEVLTTMRGVFSDWSKYLETDIDKFVALQENGGPLGEDTERAIDLAAQSDQQVSVEPSEYTLHQMSGTNYMYDDHADFAGQFKNMGAVIDVEEEGKKNAPPARKLPPTVDFSRNPSRK